MWANPFKITDTCSREECIRKFEVYIREKIEREKLQGELLSLKGKVLGCWCKPEGCHGDVLLRLIEEYDGLAFDETAKGEGAATALPSKPPAKA
jgi:hypothetical protein